MERRAVVPVHYTLWVQKNVVQGTTARAKEVKLGAENRAVGSR